ncbi:hypothetical protein ABH944_007782 [Caballeronia udeis]|uniref:Uncharacterized protein n=1 Tax=Caballeronia udeis TaxID=1232866 RepID=A0ABW8MUT5_9BURK
MLIFEITTPGARLVTDDHDQWWKITGLLQHLKLQFFEANAALNLFNQASDEAPKTTSPDFASYERDRQRRAVIQRELEQERGAPTSEEDIEEIRFDTEVRLKRERWLEGAAPRELLAVTPFIYARAFLYALDMFEKFLGVLAAEPDVPEAITQIHRQLLAIFPSLRAIRNSNQHFEDRARGLGAGKPPTQMELKPVDNEFVKAAEGAVLAVNVLNGSKYGSTMADGHYGEVDVSIESMEHLQRILESVLASFQWRGPKQHLPSL